MFRNLQELEIDFKSGSIWDIDLFDGINNSFKFSRLVSLTIIMRKD